MRVIEGHIVAVLENEKTGEKKTIETHNIVTNAGDVYYAQMGCGETPTNSFANCFLGTGSTAPAKTNDWGDITYIATSEKAPTTNYPQTDDSDSDNTGAGTDVITYLYEWTAGDGDWSSINEGVIAAALASSTDPILCHFQFAAAFDKDSSTTLKLFVNHTANGV